jgi:hypothetical protein
VQLLTRFGAFTYTLADAALGASDNSHVASHSATNVGSLGHVRRAHYSFAHRAGAQLLVPLIRHRRARSCNESLGPFQKIFTPVV